MSKLFWIASQIDVSQQEIDIPQASLTDVSVKNAMRLAFGLAGGIALIVITLAGLKYVLSQGNPQETANAKNTILYALIGLVVSALAYSIVTFFVTEATR